MLDLACSLHFKEPAFATNQIGPSTMFNLFRDTPCQSIPDQPNPRTIEVRLSLSQPLLVQLETYRHSLTSTDFEAVLSFRATTAWLAQTGNAYPEDPRPIGDHPFSADVGLFSFLVPFHTTKIENLPLRIPSSHWITAVLPGVGFNQLRLVEVVLPVLGGWIPKNAVDYFDRARKYYDQGNYRECIGQCRDVRNSIEQHTGATQKQKVGDVVKDNLGLAPDAPQIKFLNEMWEGLVNITNVARHTSLPSRPLLSRADAHACLLLTALVLEYLEQLR